MGHPFSIVHGKPTPNDVSAPIIDKKAANSRLSRVSFPELQNFGYFLAEFVKSIAHWAAVYASIEGFIFKTKDWIPPLTEDNHSVKSLESEEFSYIVRLKSKFRSNINKNIIKNAKRWSLFMNIFFLFRFLKMQCNC